MHLEFFRIISSFGASVRNRRIRYLLYSQSPILLELLISGAVAVGDDSRRMMICETIMCGLPAARDLQE